VKLARGEGVFIGPESSGRLVLRVYIQYLSTTVQSLSRTSRYYSKGIPKSSVRLVLSAYIHYTIHRVRLYYLQSIRSMGDHSMSVLKDSSIRSTFQCMFALKEKTVHPPTIAYVRTKRQTRRQIPKMPF
jgi:hypothetical protein